MSDRPVPPRRRLDAHIHVGADSTAELGVHLLDLATALLTDVDVPESVDRYTVGQHAVGHCVITVDPDITPESYQDALLTWARDTLRTHPRADHRADAEEPF